MGNANQTNYSSTTLDSSTFTTPFTKDSQKKWIIIGSVLAVVFIGVAIGLSVFFINRSESNAIPPLTPGSHKYICLAHANGHECVVDDNNGLCDNQDCCQFTCSSNNVCQWGCTGTYNTALQCIQDCSDKSEQFFDCSGTGSCQPVTSSTGFKNDPCCGTCPDGCPADITDLRVLNADIIDGSGIGEFFGMLLKAQITATENTLRCAVLTEVDQGSVFVITFNDTNNELLFSSTPIYTFLQPLSGRNVSFGARASSVGFIYNNIASQTRGELAVEVPNLGWTVQAGNFKVDPLVSYTHQELPATLFYATDSSYVAITAANIPFPTSPPTGTLATNVTSIAGGFLRQDRLMFFGAGSENQVTFALFNSDAATWISLTLNPFVQSIPSDVDNFGQYVSCSDDASVVLVGGTNYVVLYELSNGNQPISNWKWSSVGEQRRSSVSSVAVSRNGRVLAWGDGQQGIIYVSTKVQGQNGFRDSQLISIPNITTPFGYGGLDIVQVSPTKYAILAGSGNGINPTSSQKRLYYGIVELE